MTTYRLVDLAFDPAEPRDDHGRWVGLLHRGLRFDLGSAKSAFDSADDRSKAQMILTRWRASGTGMHWSSDEQWARDWATRFAELSPPDRVHVVITVKHPGSKAIETDSETLREHGVGQYQAEPEVPLRPDAEVVPVKVSWWEKDPHDPADGTWHSVDLQPDLAAYRPERQIDLASPGVKRRQRPKVKHVVPPPIQRDVTVRHIAEILLRSSRFHRVPSDFPTEVEGLRHLLAPYGIRTTAIRMALGLTHKEGGGRRGTAHAPNARLQEHEATLEGQVRDVRDSEVYFRAGYLANAADRMQRAMNAGATQREALRREAPYYRLHEEARRGRLKAAAQVQQAARLYGETTRRGTLVGWYLNPLLKNEVECITADGHNFYAEEGTVIGLPGSVHNRCGCYAGPPHEGATLVNEALHNVVAIQRGRVRPKFKVKARRTA